MNIRTVACVVGGCGWLAVAAAPASAQHPGSDEIDTCVSCHELEEDEALSLPVPEWRESVHAIHFVSCDACHGGDPRLEDADESMSEEAGFLENPSWTEMHDFCGVCHEEIAAHYARGAFGRAMEDGVLVATCATCHMQDGHRIGPSSPDELRTEAACPDCPTVAELPDTVATLEHVRDRHAALLEAMAGVEAKGIALADLQQGLEGVHADFVETVHEFDPASIDAASALALTQVDALDERVASLDAEADRRRRLGIALLLTVALVAAALWGTRRTLGD